MKDTKRNKSVQMANKTPVNKVTGRMSINSKPKETVTPFDQKALENLLIDTLNKIFVESFYEQYNKDQKELSLKLEGIESQIKALMEKESPKLDFTKDFEIYYKSDDKSSNNLLDSSGKNN